jgi:O-antigen/teichoic acid export membrane protein
MTTLKRSTGIAKRAISAFDKGGAIYTGINFLIYAIYFVRALLIPKILDSHAYGVFSMFNLYLRFTTIFDMGGVSYLQKEVATNFQKGGEYDHQLERQVVVLNTALVFVSTIFFLLFNRDIAGQLTTFDYLFWISIAVFSQIYVIRTGILRSLEQFSFLSKLVLINAGLSLSIALFYIVGIKNIYLIYATFLLSVFLPVVFFLIRIKFRPELPLKIIRHSWPIFLYNILFYLYANIDKFSIKSNAAFLQFSAYALYSTIVTAILMAVSLLWSMFYSKLFNLKSNLSETLDTVNVIIVFCVVCVLKLTFPLLIHFFPDYLHNKNYYNIAILYAALVYFLPNTLIRYLNDRRSLLYICAILCFHLLGIALINYFNQFWTLIPFSCMATYLLFELVGFRQSRKTLLAVRILVSLLVAWICLL